MKSDRLPSKFSGNLRGGLATFLCTVLATPSAASAASFPNYPLQTGATNVPPNILFILDDSGSMEYATMPDGRNDLRDSPRDRSYLNNAVYYDPRIEYRPWVKADGTRWPNASVTCVSPDRNLVAYPETNCRDLRNNNESIFYVPKSGVTSSTSASDFVKYWIRNNGGTAQVVREVSSSPVLSTQSWTQNIGENEWAYQSFNVPAGTVRLVVTTVGNTNNRGDADLYVRRGGNPTTNNYDYRSWSNTSNETVTIDNPTAGTWYLGVYNYDSGSNDRSVRGNVLTATAYGESVEVGTATGRSQPDELQNIANWYTYHRTRMKAAKAGASEAFSLLGDNVRVGYRTIWNRNNYDIPVGTYSDNREALFKGAARETWFNRLFGAQGNDGTPLRSALDSAGRYFSDSSATGPYGPQTGAAQLQCRQNFTILTTDGYWNSNFGSINVGDQEGTDGARITNHSLLATDPNYNIVRYTASHPFRDGANVNRENTLADIAMKYWKTDLRTDMDNIVPSSTSNPAFWQHMVTFGIAIGLKGTLDQSSVAEIRRDGRPRINGTAVSWPDPEMGNQSGTAEIAARIDDLLHAAVNGHGEFIAATNASDFRDALNSVLGQIQARLASGSNVATNSTSFQANTAMFQATYMASAWTGDLVAHDVTEVGGISPAEKWRVSQRIAASMTDGNNSNDFDDRTVLTWNGTGGALFPTATQASALARTTGAAVVTGADNARYIKGDQSRERSNGGVLRNRTNLLGDIVNSSPFFVADTNTIYVGANDGMLHAINAQTGDVMFSYVPAGLDFAALASLSHPDYTHRFFVDGPVTVSSHNVVPGKNYLMASLGRGGKGVFALDVTDPAGFANSDVLWDKTGLADDDMGYVLGASVIAKGNNGKTLAIVGNGIDSENGDAVLYVYDVTNGTQLAKLAVGEEGGNGLSAPRAADINGDGTADYVYAGDLKGNVWKFDLSANSTNNWRVAFNGSPLFTAVDDEGNAQSITGGVAIAREPGSRRIWVTFGTGRLISQGDMDAAGSGTQSIYGLIDSGTAIASRDDLTTRTIAAVSADGTRRAFENYAPLPVGSRGWYVDLGVPTAGERVVSGPRVNGRAVWISSIIPDAGDGCEAGGAGYLNSLDLFTGTSPSNGGDGSTSFFDLDGDGSGEDETVTGSDGEDRMVGSVDLGVGMPTESSQIDELVLICGSDGTCEDLKVPPSAGQPKRLGWREVYSR